MRIALRYRLATVLQPSPSQYSGSRIRTGLWFRLMLGLRFTLGLVLGLRLGLLVVVQPSCSRSSGTSVEVTVRVRVRFNRCSVYGLERGESESEKMIDWIVTYLVNELLFVGA